MELKRSAWVIGGLLSITVIVLLAMEQFLGALVASQFVLWMGCTIQMKRFTEQKQYKQAKNYKMMAYICAGLFTVSAIVLWI